MIVVEMSVHHIIRRLVGDQIVVGRNYANGGFGWDFFLENAVN